VPRCASTILKPTICWFSSTAEAATLKR
jgi:hypothetical protein